MHPIRALKRGLRKRVMVKLSRFLKRLMVFAILTLRFAGWWLALELDEEKYTEVHAHILSI